MKNEKGITLTSLVIMVIIILILASIATYSGVGTIRYVKFNKARSEMQAIQTNVNKWKEEYLNGNDDILNYGEDLNSISSNLSQKVNDTFSKAEIIDSTIKDNYKLFSEDYLKEKLSLDASFDYLVNIIDRDVILVGGVIYNSKTYYTLKDFGLINVEENLPNSISFNLEQGNNTDIIISDLKLKNEQEVESEGLDFSKFVLEYTKSSENDWKDITKDVVKFEDGEDNNKITKFKFSVTDIGEYDVRISTIDKKIRNTKEITLEARPGIKVGDYITYTSPTASVTFTDADTGYTAYATTPEILLAKNTFRVMDIDSHGNMTLMGVMTSEDPMIYFTGALGYNNSVYTLNAKCSELYKDTSKGITARSIKVEDITDKFNDTGKGKLTTYISNQMQSLSLGTDVTKGTEEDGITLNNTVTYSNGNTNCPDLFQYEVGGSIDNTASTVVIGQSESYSGYGGLTTLATKTPKPTNLTVTYTYYNTTHSSTDFADTTKSEIYYNMFFETSTTYWLASRCVRCYSSKADFRLRRVENNKFIASSLYDSDDGTPSMYQRCVCPIVFLPSSVQITVSTDTSEYHKTDPHIVQ